LYKRLSTTVTKYNIKLDGCIVWNAHNKVFGLKRSTICAVHKLFTSCIRRGLVSHDTIVDGDWLPATEWCQCYLPCCQPAWNIAENLGRFIVWSAQAKGMTELIPMLEMETRNAVDGYFGSEFPVICNHCALMVVW